MRITRSTQLAGVLAYTRDGKPLYVLDLVDSWASHVRRLAVEAAAPLDPLANTWGVFDFIAALYIRDRLDHALSAIGDDVESPCVAATDELFRLFTEFDKSQALRRCDADVPLEPWWWQRIPTAGPALEELKAW
jgi:hypothetical protein